MPDPSHETPEQIAARAIADVEHYREGLLQIALLVGVGFSIVAPVQLLGGTGAIAGVVVLGSVAASVAFAVCLHRHARLFWELGRRPWLVLPPALAWGAVIAGEGVGGHTLLGFAALMFAAAPMAAGRPAYGLAAMIVVLVSSTAFGFAADRAGTGVLYAPLTAPWIFQCLGGLMLAATCWAVSERQLRHVIATTVRRLVDERDATAPQPAHHHGDRPRRLIAGPPPHQQLPRPNPDIADLARDDLGLTARQMEMLLLSLAGYQEAEIPTRLAHLGPHRRPIAKKTVYTTLKHARERIANAHQSGYVTTEQAVALTQDALDRRTDHDGQPVTTLGGLPPVESGKRRSQASPRDDSK